MYIAPSQWTYQCPPLSPPLQPEMVANHPYPVAPTFHQSTWHTHTPPTRYPNMPRRRNFVPTHQEQACTQRAPVPAKPAWEKPWRAHHTKAPCRSYFGSRSRTRGSRQRGRERERIDFHEAVEAIRQVIAFAQLLPHVTNNRRNTERRIRQRKTRRAESSTSTTSSSRGHSPTPQPPKPLPPPGVGAYRPPML